MNLKHSQAIERYRYSVEQLSGIQLRVSFFHSSQPDITVFQVLPRHYLQQTIHPNNVSQINSINHFFSLLFFHHSILVLHQQLFILYWDIFRSRS